MATVHGLLLLALLVAPHAEGHRLWSMLGNPTQYPPLKPTQEDHPPMLAQPKVVNAEEFVSKPLSHENEQDLYLYTKEEQCPSVGKPCPGYNAITPDPPACKNAGCCYYSRQGGVCRARSRPGEKPDPETTKNPSLASQITPPRGNNPTAPQGISQHGVDQVLADAKKPANVGTNADGSTSQLETQALGAIHGNLPDGTTITMPDSGAVGEQVEHAQDALGEHAQNALGALAKHAPAAAQQEVAEDSAKEPTDDEAADEAAGTIPKAETGGEESTKEESGAVPAAPPMPASADGACALTAFTHASVKADDNAPILIDPDWRDGLFAIAEAAKEAGVTLLVTSSARLEGSVNGAIVEPATHSCHMVGHAIDCNIYDKAGTLHTSTGCLSSLNECPPEVKSFITAAEELPNTRWGGRWTKKDPVHFDDNLYQRDAATWKAKYEAVQDALRKKKVC